MTFFPFQAPSRTLKVQNQMKHDFWHSILELSIVPAYQAQCVIMWSAERAAEPTTT